MTIQFDNYHMFCFSTGNQTVNFLPAKQLNIPQVIVATTEKEKGENLKRVFNTHKITSKFFNIGNFSNIHGLKEEFLKETQSIENILWNITGGQKYHTLAMYEAFLERTENNHKDLILYFEANNTKFYIYDRHKKIIEIPADTYISLDDIFTLYNTNAYEKMELFPEPDTLTKMFLDAGKKALDYYEKDETFRKVFFAVMRPNPVVDEIKGGLEKQIKIFLNSIKPKLSDLKIMRTGYENFEHNINDIFIKLNNCHNLYEIRNTLQPLLLITQPQEIYNEYWNAIKRAVIEEINKKIDEKNYPLLNESLSKDKIKTLKLQIESIGGKIKEDIKGIIKRSDLIAFSMIDRNGHLFEWMVAGKIMNIIEEKSNLKSKISQIHLGVKTKPLKPDAKQDAELDIVITTRFGTTLVFEAKTYDFSGDTIEGKENQTLKKSGPYSKTIIVGPLLKSLEIRTEGEIKYPFYFDGKIIEQRANAEKHNISYACLDELDIVLEKQLLKG